MIQTKQRLAAVAHCLHRSSLIRARPLFGSSSALLASPFESEEVVRQRLNPHLTVSTRRASTATNYEKKQSLNEKLLRPTVQVDFFGEPITFFSLQQQQTTTTTTTTTTDNAMAATNAFLLAVVSKGKSCIGGGDEAGIDLKPAHAAALEWAEAVRHAAVWNNNIHHNHRNNSAIKQQQQHAPMLAVVAVAPLLAQAGVAYVKHLDTLLIKANPGARGLPKISLMEIAETAVSCLNDDDKKNALEERERLHLQALQCLLDDEHQTALVSLLKVLRSCPGDLLALSLAMDLAFTVGDKASALRAAGSAAAYWNERRGGMITPALTGHAVATAYIALGFAVGGRHDTAEPMAERAMKEQRRLTGAVATWAQANVFDASGRIAEGISATANFDGVVNYEGAGLFFFDSRLGGYGARFSLDREERGRGKSTALRLYERHIERVLDYSGFARGQAWREPVQMAPLAWSETKTLAQGEIKGEEEETASWWDRISGRSAKKKEAVTEEDYYEIILKDGRVPSTKIDGWEPNLEDVLTWLPPTPLLLTDATLLLLRFTLNGTISSRNLRWDNMRNSWRVMLEAQEKHTGSTRSIAFCPLASLSSSLLFPPEETGGDEIGNGELATGLFKIGEMLRLGNPMTEEEKSTTIREVIADRDPNFWLPAKEEGRGEWQRIVEHMASGLDGFDEESDTRAASRNLRFEPLDFEGRPVLEHAIVYAACKAGDTQSLCLARSICSQGVSLRPNSPEEWWRYSIVLGLLGDEVGSEDALTNSINFGGGQGALR